MKYTALIIIFLILIFITGTLNYFDALSYKADNAVFANRDNDTYVDAAAKPISRSGSETRKKKDIELRLMTYNMHRGIGRSGRLDLDATSEVIRGTNAEIVALQEVERYSIRTGFKDQIKHLASTLDMHYAYRKSINLLNGEYGNGLLSRYPIVEYSTYDLPSIGEQRTILRTVVNIEGYRLAVYNTHLGLNQEERDKQLDYIMQLLAAEEIDYVLMGDMNSKVDKLTRITEVLKDSAEGSSKLEHSTFEEEDVQERIDYIFLQQKMKVKNYDVVVSEASDHYPVIAEAAAE